MGWSGLDCSSKEFGNHHYKNLRQKQVADSKLLSKLGAVPKVSLSNGRESGAGDGCQGSEAPFLSR